MCKKFTENDYLDYLVTSVMIYNDSVWQVGKQSEAWKHYIQYLISNGFVEALEFPKHYDIKLTELGKVYVDAYNEL